MTTNGYRLKERASEWFDAGLTALNVSVDSLDPRQFHQITGENKLAEVMDGIEAALAAGFKSVKINAVLLKGLNDHQLDAFLAWIRHKPIELRFIELMQTGEMDTLFRDHHASGRSSSSVCSMPVGCSSCAVPTMAPPRYSCTRSRWAGLGSSCPTARISVPVATGCGSLPRQAAPLSVR